jgi:acyl phosphate:glycerol-3-phosphate acyltransferase
MLFPILLIVAAYLIGAIPFGYLIAKAKGVDLFQAGSGNIGATNVGRILGRKFGILVFVLDFLKGAGPVALVPVFARLLPSDDVDRLQPLDWLRVGVALAALLGHLFPIYLKFRGGKGVATGAGTMFVLVPGPATIALLFWLAAVASFRMVSLGSIMAACGLCVATGLSGASRIVMGYCVVGAVFVIIKHRTNLVRLWQGKENRLEDRAMLDFLHRALHILALGIWLGSIVFFNLLAAPTIFASFRELAKSEPSDRTAHITINAGLNDTQKEQLGNALAGAAVGPIFPKFFLLQSVCGFVVALTALGWCRTPRRLNRWRFCCALIAWSLPVFASHVADKVAGLRVARYSPDHAVAEAAKRDFAEWHVHSLALSLLILLVVFALMLMAARLPPPGGENPPNRR